MTRGWKEKPFRDGENLKGARVLADLTSSHPPDGGRSSSGSFGTLAYQNLWVLIKFRSAFRISR